MTRLENAQGALQPPAPAPGFSRSTDPNTENEKTLPNKILTDNLLKRNHPFMNPYLYRLLFCGK